MLGVKETVEKLGDGRQAAIDGCRRGLLDRLLISDPVGYVASDDAAQIECFSATCSQPLDKCCSPVR
jgi:hypothetical protein